jgi:hypothetical protein
MNEQIQYKQLYLLDNVKLISDVYFCLKMVVRPKHVADNLNKIVNNY